MTQSDVDIDFLNGLQLMIDSMAASHLEKADWDDDDQKPPTKASRNPDDKYTDQSQLKGGPDFPSLPHDDPKEMVSHNGDKEHLPEKHTPSDAFFDYGIQNADDKEVDIPDRFADVPDPIKRVSHNGDEEHLPEDRRPLDTTIAGGGKIKYQRNIQNADENETEDSADKLEVASTDWESTSDLPEANHWCPDVQAWHTSDHEPAKAPSVHVNVDSKEGEDSDQSENGEDDAVEKGLPVAATLKDVEHGRDRIESEYDQNTNLDRHQQENTEESIAEPFLHRREVNEDEEEEKDEDIKKSNDGFIGSVEQTHGKAIDILKLWASVDRVLPKTDSETMLVNDINILKSFNLDETTNVEDLVTGTLLHKMLVDRASRPTAGWWESSMLIAKSIDSIDEPAFFSAFLYYEPDTFNMGDFVDIEKAGERSEYSKPQDLGEMENTSGGSPMGGLGMSADDLELSHGPKDEECDD